MDRAKNTLSLTLMMFLAAATCAAQQTIKRPRITGIAHVGFFTSDLPKALVFWHDFLGFDEPYSLPRKDSEETRIAFVKINDHQHIELFNEPPAVPRNMLSHLCFAVDDIEQMRAFLRSKGIAVLSAKGAKTRTGDYAVEIRDPDGTLIEFVQTLPTGREAQAAGRYMPETRIAPRIYHVGFLVGDSRKSIDFYSMLGFTETWRGSSDAKELSWINMKVPGGTDYIELMLYRAPSDPATWGSRNHVSLVVADIEKSVAALHGRPAFEASGNPLTIRTGVNGKRQVNLFDPDGTRVELMESQPFDGKPRPSSAAPPPIPAAP